MQTTLTNNGPIILDATCSFQKKWPRVATIRIDRRPECRPDIVMDCTDLKFADNHFDQIYCDPPHLYRTNSDHSLMMLKFKRRLGGRKSPDMFTLYGYWLTEEEWFTFIEKTNAEFYRCLKPKGILWYKITEAIKCTKPSDLIERMTLFDLVEDKSSRSKSNFGKGITHHIKFISKKA